MKIGEDPRSLSLLVGSALKRELFQNLKLDSNPTLVKPVGPPTVRRRVAVANLGPDR